MTSPLLSDFSQAVPTCSPEAPLPEVMAHLASGEGAGIVIIDGQRHPQGIIRLQSLMGYLCNLGQSPLAPLPISAVLPTRGGSPPQAADLGQPLPLLPGDSPVSDLWPILIEPSLPWSTGELPQFGPPSALIGLVDGKQQFLGLLNCDAVWRWFLQEATQWPAPAPPGIKGDRRSSRPLSSGPTALYAAAPVHPSAPPEPQRQPDDQPQLVTALSNLPATIPGQPSIIQREQAWLLELSHELKSPLTSLLGLSALLQDPRLGSLNDRQTRYVQLIHQGVRQLITQVNYLLDWARIEAGQLSLSLQEVSLNQLWPQVRQSLETQAILAIPDLTDLDTRLQWPVPGPVTTVLADPVRLKQILQNLISNALRHTDEDRACGLALEAWGPWIAMTVWDHGESVPPDWQAHLFPQQPLLPTGADSRQNRMNLALMLSWQLARLHGGDLSFVSSTKHGNHFTVLLPERVANGSEPAATRLLLLACADPEWVDAVREGCQNSRYRLAIARSPTEVIDKLTRLHPAALLLHLSPWTEAVIHRLPRPQSPLQLPILGLGQVPADGDFAWPLDTWLTRETLDHLPALLDQSLTLPQPPSTDLAGLTVLYLKASLNPSRTPVSHPGFNLSNWLYHQNCRLLEVDDIPQADLLARVWRPHVVILDRAIAQPADLLSQISQLPHLKTRPLVVLTLAMVEASYQFPDLKIFSCLEPSQAAPSTYAASLSSTIHQAVS